MHLPICKSCRWFLVVAFVLAFMPGLNAQERQAALASGK
jgi:hypothetical protein